MFYIGREIIGVEYGVGNMTLDHWAFGPHHVWSVPETGTSANLYRTCNIPQVSLMCLCPISESKLRDALPFHRQGLQNVAAFQWSPGVPKWNRQCGGPRHEGDTRAPGMLCRVRVVFAFLLKPHCSLIHCISLFPLSMDALVRCSRTFLQLCARREVPLSASSAPTPRRRRLSQD